MRDRIGRTLAKNDMNDVRKLFVLPDDSSLILNEFQKSIEEAEIDNHFEIISFCFRFGEKATDGVSLNHFKREHRKRVTIHCAVDISSDEIELMWSRAGVQEIVGERGVLNSCYSFRDCVCYQSNLDGRLMDIIPGISSNSAAARQIAICAIVCRYLLIEGQILDIIPCRDALQEGWCFQNQLQMHCARRKEIYIYIE